MELFRGGSLKDSANQEKNQIYLSFSEMQPIFETAKQASLRF